MQQWLWNFIVRQEKFNSFILINQQTLFLIWFNALYDYTFLCTSSRFTENEILIAGHLDVYKKPFSVIRTKCDADIPFTDLIEKFSLNDSEDDEESDDSDDDRTILRTVKKTLGIKHKI